jgi:ABC-type nitrate/sulfonate/bicarbonate transport system permease component
MITVLQSKHLFSRLVPWTTVVIFIALWEAVSRLGIVPPFALPAPSQVARTLVQEFEALLPHVAITTAATLSGLGIAFLVAVILAFAMAVLPLVRAAVYPLLVVSQTVPLIALAPLFVIWFGFGILPKVLVVGLVCFFPIVVSLMEGISSVDRDTENLLRSMGAGRRQVFFRAYVPASIPHLFGGLRIAATYSVMGAVIGEWLGGTQGLGVYMVRAQKAFALDRVFAAIAVVVVLSLLVFGTIVGAQRLASPWRSIHESTTERAA